MQIKINKLTVEQQDFAYLETQLHNTQVEIPKDRADINTDLDELTTLEQNASNVYYLNVNIDVYASNVLASWSYGSPSWQDVEQALDYDSITGTYENTLSQVLKNKGGWYYIDSQCQPSYLEPKQDRFKIRTLQGKQNWDFFVCYPKAKDLRPLSFLGVDLADGIAIYEITLVTVGQKNMVQLRTVLKHGLIQGDEFNFYADNPTLLDGRQKVFKLGDIDGFDSDNTLIVDLTLPSAPPILGNRPRLKRVYKNQESSYHSRWLQKITDTFQYETYPNGFRQTLYGDMAYGMTFKSPIVNSEYRDCFNRPLDSFYLYVVKKDDYDGNVRFWTDIQSGLDLDVAFANYDIATIYSFGTQPIELDVNQANSLMFGDIVEWNPLEYKTTQLEVAHHRFNMQNREENSFFEGYYYRALYTVPIGKFEDVETVSFDENQIPDYALQLSDGRYVYRNLLSKAEYSQRFGLPFVGGIHYLFYGLQLYVRRQDPCRNFDFGVEPLIGGRCDEDIQNTIFIDPDEC